MLGSTDNLRGTFDAALDTMEEKCLSATVELYTEVGKLEQLGEDQCPERLRVWLKKTRADALEYVDFYCRHLFLLSIHNKFLFRMLKYYFSSICADLLRIIIISYFIFFQLYFFIQI